MILLRNELLRELGIFNERAECLDDIRSIILHLERLKEIYETLADAKVQFLLAQGFEEIFEDGKALTKAVLKENGFELPDEDVALIFEYADQGVHPANAFYYNELYSQVMRIVKLLSRAKEVRGVNEN